MAFDEQHFTEELVEVEGLELSRSTVRRILRASDDEPCNGDAHRGIDGGAIDVRKRGQMILRDGSRHDWLVVTVRHQLDGWYLAYHGGQCIGQAKGIPPKASTQSARTLASQARKLDKARRTRDDEARDE